jgi:hypothetical protein
MYSPSPPAIGENTARTSSIEYRESKPLNIILPTHLDVRLYVKLEACLAEVGLDDFANGAEANDGVHLLVLQPRERLPCRYGQQPQCDAAANGKRADTEISTTKNILFQYSISSEPKFVWFSQLQPLFVNGCGAFSRGFRSFPREAHIPKCTPFFV